MTRAHYLRPSRFDRAVNAAVGWLARRGVSLMGAAELSVRGRTSGEWRSIPVNPLTHDGRLGQTPGRLAVAAGNTLEHLAGGGKLTANIRVGRGAQRVRAHPVEELGLQPEGAEEGVG